ncbi:MAG: hypothetical protein CSA66_00570 [Proteobacteria bacterium]|nr:MAG: hypothetical protein CSA66_00570 [Pseudomonadota bacterium]
MPPALSVVAATTHPPEYRLHKYWSRKPANVVRGRLEALLSAPGVVVDPCCGSGVVAREAALLGHTVHASDVNPVAVELSTLMVEPPEPDAFLAAVEPALAWLDAACARRWVVSPGDPRPARYAVHAVVVDCRGCGAEVVAVDAALSPVAKRCPRCAAPLRFNLEWLRETRVVGVAPAGGGDLIRDADVLAYHQRDGARGDASPPASLRAPFADNRRILAFHGMAAISLFTARNLALLAGVAERLGAIAAPDARRAGQLLLTASVAQCSRLIPYRNNMTSGGPAWSVPGFWVPPLHLETHPALHLRARLARFATGLRPLSRRRPRGPATVRRASAERALADLRARGVTADLVFLDPPYGESVPFIEFSGLWNAFLGELPAPDDDMSVSDRLPQGEAWARYEAALDRLVAAAAAALSPGGRVLLTFNNHDLRAWRALLAALHAHGLGCDEVSYQIPAVVSSKAAFHPDNSYVGDLWAVCAPRPAGWAPARDTAPAVAALVRCASSRGGAVPPKLARRTLAVAWLAHDLAADLVDGWDALLAAHLAPAAGGALRLRRAPDPDVPRVAAIAREVATQRVGADGCAWPELYQAVAARCVDLGLPDPGEVRALLADSVRFAGRRAVPR